MIVVHVYWPDARVTFVSAPTCSLAAALVAATTMRRLMSRAAIIWIDHVNAPARTRASRSGDVFDEIQGV